MQVKELKNDGLNYELEVVVPSSDIDKHVETKLREYSRTVKIPGFRPGKVPLSLMKQRYGRSVLGEVLEVAVNDATAKVIKDKNLRPALQPKIEVKEFDEGKDLTYTMEVEVLPEFKVMDLKSIKLTKQVAEPADEAIEETLKMVASQNRETVTVERAAKNGDMVSIDFHGRTADDNKEHEGMHAHGHTLELGSGQFIAGFEEQLVGKKAGDKVEVNVTFPKEYHADELAGREAIFDVDINEVREGKAAEINDDLAKKLGLDDVNAMKDAIKTQLQGQYDNMSKMKLKRALLDMLDESHDFEIPAGMLDMEFGNIKQQLAMERQQDLKDGELQLSDEEQEEMKAIAGRRVRLGMVLAEIGRENNIKVSDHELQKAVIEEAQRYPGQEAQIFEYYSKNEQAREALRAPVFEDKVVDFIAELADITEKTVSAEELNKADDESYTPKKAETKKKPAAKKSSAKKSPAKKKTAKKADSAE